MRKRQLRTLLATAVVLGSGLGGAVRGQETGGSYQGSVVVEKATAGVRPLSLDEAIRRGLRYNLGLVLSGEQARAARGARLDALQPLLPAVDATAKESVQQVDLQAEGLKIPGFPAIIGPFGYTDIRASMEWSLANISSLKNYLAAKHNFAGANLSIEDAKDMVVLTVGNAYMACISDAARVRMAQARLSTATVSLNQADALHQAGTAPLLDVLRARVDYQTEQQSLIAARNLYAKDKIALARAIGLPLDQKFDLTDTIPYRSLDNVDPAQAVAQALGARQDLRALEQQVKAGQDAKSAATAERYPTVAFSGDYGDIGPNLGSSHGTFDAVGTASVPVFAEARLRGDARVAQAQLDERQAQLNDLRGQIGADVRENILDIQAAAKEVQVEGSNVDLAKEALSEAQQRYAAGVSDNLAVSQAQTSLAQAEEQYISSLYQHNVAKLALARALGIARTNYKDYVGGK